MENKLNVMEQWLQVLLVSYQVAPDKQITQYINYYLSRILAHEDCIKCTNKSYQYQQMLKFWQWRLAHVCR